MENFLTGAQFKRPAAKGKSRSFIGVNLVKIRAHLAIASKLNCHKRSIVHGNNSEDWFLGCLENPFWLSRVF
jgi:hypothetical protein